MALAIVIVRVKIIATRTLASLVVARVPVVSVAKAITIVILIAVLIVAVVTGIVVVVEMIRTWFAVTKVTIAIMQQSTPLSHLTMTRLGVKVLSDSKTTVVITMIMQMG